jgi:methyl-accepting chemotaxis protein
MRSAVRIRKKIGFGFAAIVVLALVVIYAVVEGKVKPDLILESQEQISVNQGSLSDLLSAKLDQVQLLTSSLALASSTLPKDEALFKRVFPSIIDNHGDEAIAGGGIWPEPNSFDAGVERRSFFWGRTGSGIAYFDDYNDPSGSGYHGEGWYQVGRSTPVDRCAWSEAYIDPFTKIPMVTCTIPYKEAGAFKGVATVDMMLGGINQVLSQYGQENGGYVFAIDSTGQMISFPSEAENIVLANDSLMTANQLANKVPWLAQGLTQSATLKEAVHMPIEDDQILNGDAYLDMFRHPETGWIIGLVVPKNRMIEVAQSMGVFLMLAIGALLVVVGMVSVLFARRILRSVEQTTEQIHDLVKGSGWKELDVDSMDEIGELRDAVNQYGAKLKQLLSKIQEESHRLVGDASKLNEFSLAFRDKATSLSDENHMLAAATEELGVTSKEVSSSAEETKVTIDQIHAEIQTSGNEMTGVIKTMRHLTSVMNTAQENILKLDEDSRRANGMLSVIRDIAEQTNLLALNAAIEAARAGDTGRGFAVVADEVRNLAAKSESSAVEIEQVLSRLQDASKLSVASMEKGQQETERAVTTAEDTANHLQDVVGAFERIAQQATQISVAASEQQRVSDDLTRFVDRLQELTESNAQDSTQLNRMSEEIDAIAKRLDRLK